MNSLRTILSLAAWDPKSQHRLILRKCDGLRRGQAWEILLAGSLQMQGLLLRNQFQGKGAKTLTVSSRNTFTENLLRAKERSGCIWALALFMHANTEINISDEQIEEPKLPTGLSCASQKFVKSFSCFSFPIPILFPPVYQGSIPCGSLLALQIFNEFFSCF